VLEEATGASWAPRQFATNGEAEPVRRAPTALSSEQVRAATIASLRALMLIRSYRVRGHLEARLDPARFIRLHRSTIVRRDRIAGLRHDGFGVWCADLTNGESVRIGRTFLADAKAMAGR